MEKQNPKENFDSGVKFGIESTAFIMSDWMRTIEVPDKDIEEGLMRVSEHWTETLPSLFDVDINELREDGSRHPLLEIRETMESLIRCLNDDEPIFERTKTDNVVPLVSDNA
jgi:hypothetical protein